MKPKNKKNKWFLWNEQTYTFDFKAYLFFLSTIDLILTNHKQSLLKSDVYETGISDHHKMIL